VQVTTDLPLVTDKRSVLLVQETTDLPLVTYKRSAWQVGGYLHQ
jgi:hypothetical protein